jgi:chaperonin GroES
MKLLTHITIDESVALSPNLADRFSDEDQTTIAGAVWDGYVRDKNSRQKWERRMEAGMDLAMQIQKDKNFPWPNCANVIFPLVTIAALQFSARAYSNIISGTDVVRYRTIGSSPPANIIDRARRISNHMSWQVLEEDTSWEEQHDRLLINLAIVGTNFVKTYFDPSPGHNVSELVMARDLVLDYFAKSVDAAARKTHIVPLYRNQVWDRCESGIFCDVRDEAWFKQPPTITETQAQHDNRQGIETPQTDDDTPFVTLEQHRFLDLDGDGYLEPYVVTIEMTSKKLLRLVARWDSDEAVKRNEAGKLTRIKPVEYFTKYSFIPAPDGGIYDVGFGVLLGPLNEGVDSAIDQLLDAGTMQNSGGGFLGRGVKIRGGNYTIAPNEWKRVDSTGDDLRKNIVPKPEVEPSAVTFQLIGLLIQYADRIAGTTEQMVGESPGQNTPAETNRNTQEQGMQAFSTIFKRVWRCMKEEFKKLHQLNAQFLPSKQPFGSQEDYILREDYKSDPDQVCPVADPNITSRSQKMNMAMAVANRAQVVPGYATQETEKDVLKAIGVQDIDRVYPGADKVPPLPNPKMAVENMKLESKKMELEQKKWELMTTLQTSMKKNMAEIRKLEAETIKLLSGTQNERAALQLQAYETVISAFKEHGEMLNERMKLLQGDENGGEGKPGADKGGGSVQPVETGAGNSAALPVPAQMETVGAGSMG